MRDYHYLESKKFAGHHLRNIVEWRGHWLALASRLVHSNVDRVAAESAVQTS